MLLIDSGNSAIKCRLIDKNKTIDQLFSVHQDISLTSFSNYLKTVNTDKVYLASVSEEKITHTIKHIVYQQTDSDFTRLHTLPGLGGLTNGYENYAQLGVDRWLTLLGAFSQRTNDCLIVDAGSAITIDLLSLQKGHLGGAILPGFNTSLSRFKQLFPAVDFSHADINLTDMPGKSTLQCIHASDRTTTVVQIKGLLQNWQSLLTAPVSIILCGQDNGLICQQLDLDTIIVPDLVFTGMLKQIELLG